jgi:hypothetical protein
MAASNATVRPIRADERADWEPLWKGYQAFYKVVISDQTTAATWARLHDPAEPMEVLGAYLDERLCGIVHYLFHRSCWTTGDAQSWARARADPGGRGQSTGRGREPHLLAHP